jgi:pyruvate dehydrogenase E2 component (dihydrolipoamide acetyltransferase)
VPKEIILPIIAADFESGTIESWSKKEGDAVAKGEVLFSVETDKAIVEIEAEQSGVLGKIMVAAGTEDVLVNAVIGLLLQEGESVSDLDDLPTSVESQPPPTASELSPALDESQSITSQVPGSAALQRADSGRIFASPLARRIAEDLGVDLNGLTGRGPRGRILKADVELTGSSGLVAVGDKSIVAAATVEPKSGRNYTAIPHSNMRKTIARRLTESKRDVPHFYLSTDCQLDALLTARKDFNVRSPEGEGAYKLSVNDFIVKACALALRDVPEVNASWTEEAIHQHHNVDISVAVATEGGLITPIVQDADSKGLVAISGQIKDLAARAREGKLKPAEFQGGGFTISNLGMYGTSNFSAIINPPQSCILAVGAGEQRAVVKDGELIIGTVMSCTLSADHRSVNGDVAARFMQAFKRYIEDPFYMLARQLL